MNDVTQAAMEARRNHEYTVEADTGTVCICGTLRKDWPDKNFWAHQAEEVAKAIRDELRKELFGEVSVMLNDRAMMYERDDEEWPCQIRELKMLANAFRTYAEGVGTFNLDTLRAKRKLFEDKVNAVKALEPTGEREWRSPDGVRSGWCATVDWLDLQKALATGDEPFGREDIIAHGENLVKRYHPTLWREMQDEEAARKGTD